MLWNGINFNLQLIKLKRERKNVESVLSSDSGYVYTISSISEFCYL